MGEEEKKKPEEKKMAEEIDVKKSAADDLKEKKEENQPSEKSAPEKKEEGKTEEPNEGKDAKEQDSPPPPPPEIVLKVYMHCEGCARKVRRCLKGFEGVEDVITDCKTHKVIIKGEKADPLKVLDRVQKKSHRQVELLSPIPKPPPPAEEPKPEEKETPKSEEKKEEVVTVILSVHMHCEGCAQEIKKRILRMKGVDSVEPDLKASQVTVTGVFDPPKLVNFVHRRTGKHAVIVKTDPETKEKDGEAKEGKEEKAKEEGGKEKKGDVGDGEGKEGEGGGDGKDGGEAAAAAAEEAKVVEVIRNEYQYYAQRYAMEMYAYPPQIFSDENPNACSVM